jgi:hypothetical protein
MVGPMNVASAGRRHAPTVSIETNKVLVRRFYE